MYQIKLEIFEGPFDLLLHLIKLNEVDIYDIPLGMITSQYLEYIELMKELDLEIAGEFLVIASELLKIKSASLLPRDEAAEQVLDELKKSLIDRIVEYKKYKEAAVKLQILAETQQDYFKKEPTTDKEIIQGNLNYIEVDLFSLLTAYKNFIESFEKRKIPTIKGADYTIEDKTEYILNTLNKKNSIKFSEILETAECRLEIIVTFIAILELIKLNKIFAHQLNEFDEIYISKKELHDYGIQKNKEYS